MEGRKLPDTNLAVYLKSRYPFITDRHTAVHFDLDCLNQR
jgi:hypothetical protein